MKMFLISVFLAKRSEKAMAPHSSTLAWKIPWTEEPGRLQSMGLQSQTRLSDFTLTFHFQALGEGKGNPLQCSCLENRRDGRAWWAAICGVAQSRTRLEQLSSSSSRQKMAHPVEYLIIHNRRRFSQSFSKWRQTTKSKINNHH